MATRFSREAFGNGEAEAGRTEQELAMGRHVRVIGETDYVFDGRISGVDQVIPISGAIPSRDWVSGMLLVRLHTTANMSTSATLTVEGQSVLPSPDEPQTLFKSSTAVGSVSFTSSDTAGTFKQATLSGIGAFVRVVLKWAQGGTAGGANGQSVSISVELVGRSA